MDSLSAYYGRQWNFWNLNYGVSSHEEKQSNVLLNKHKYLE